jgi:hypothetical protein
MKESARVAVTCSEKLSQVVEYEEGTVDTHTMTQIKDKAIEFLLNGENKNGDDQG